jgi:hypothetical protein
MNWKTWKCKDCYGLEDDGCTCEVQTGWPEKPTGCPITINTDCHWELVKDNQDKDQKTRPVTGGYTHDTFGGNIGDLPEL